ncbi:MAG: peptidase S8, partial [Fervidobacterium sp.]
DHDSGYGLLKLNNALAGTLPTTGGVELYKVRVTDTYNSWGVPTAFVQLIRSRGSSYYAKTAILGDADFYQIDMDEYELIIGGPDSWERALAPYDPESLPGAWQIALRMEEERQYNEKVNITASSTKTVVFSSDFKVEFGSDFNGEVVIKNLLDNQNIIMSYQKNNTYDLSDLSGFVTIGVEAPTPVDTNTTIEGTVTLNGYKIPISGVILKDATSTYVDDFGGIGIYWIVFGKN